jgi:potassium channel subfamily K
VIPRGKSAESVRCIAADKVRVIAVNAVSLGFALVVNFCLLMTMARRLPFSVAQPIVIVGWYLASVLLIVILIILGREVGSPESVAQYEQLTQGYYYGCIAAALYFTLSSMLIMTVYGAYSGHYKREFNLTKSQRTLMIQTISFLVYILAGSAVYSHIEGWRFTDAVYWSDFTLLTIGTGTPSPATHLGRGLLFPYAFGGIIIIGVVIGSIRSLVLERGKTKMSSRLIEKTRNFGAKMMTSPVPSAGARKLVPGVDLTVDHSELNEQERRKREFHAMRKVREIASMEHRWISLLLSGISVGILWFVGALIFEHAEASQEWTYFVSLYFTYTSLLTIGYGDFNPESNWGKTFFVFWSLLAVPTMTVFISNLGDTVISTFRDWVNYIGELTILPGERSFRARFKELFSRGVPFFSAKKAGDKQSPQQDHSNGLEKHVERAESALEEEQLREGEEAHERGDFLAEDIHYQQYLLIREIRQMFRYINSTPSKQFNYDEWAYYLKILDEDEAEAQKHREPSIDGRSTGNSSADMQPDDQLGKWSWIGPRSPLLGDKEEAEWLLEALAYKLEANLRKLSDEYRQKQKTSDDSSRRSDEQ